MADLSLLVPLPEPPSISVDETETDIISDKPGNPAYTALLDDFDDYCEQVIDKYTEKNSSSSKDEFTNLSTSPSDNDCIKKTAGLCAQLSNWIYIVSDKIPEPTVYEHNNNKPEWMYRRVVVSKSTQIVQWALLQHSKQLNSMYLIFKGSTPDRIFDTIADTGLIPIPIFCDPKNKAYWDIAVHSGIYASLMRDFHDIWKVLNDRIHKFNRLYVCGHSLGGGLAKVFGLESINHGYLPLNKSMNIIVFGSPSVISLKTKFNKLSANSQLILNKFHDSCHCFVNKFDPIARLPTKSEWMMTVLPYAFKKVITEKIKSTSSFPLVVIQIFNQGIRSVSTKFIKTASKYMDILSSYKPFGTYYFCQEEAFDKSYIIKHPQGIQDILGFMPPHKISVESLSNSIEVCHFGTKIDGIDYNNKFSLKYLCYLTKIIDDMDSMKNDKEASGLLIKQQQINLIDLLTKENDYDGDWNKYDSIYVVMKKDNENIITKQIRKERKLRGRDWIKIVCNHLTAEYMDLFSHTNIEELTVSHVEHHKSITASKAILDQKQKKSIFKTIKRGSLKVWNNIEKKFKNRL